MREPRHVVCPHCASINRIPGERLADGPNCGKCHEALFDGHPLKLGDDNFQQHMTRNDIPLLVDDRIGYTYS